jgi:hypothetical protein
MAKGDRKGHNHEVPSRRGGIDPAALAAAALAAAISAISPPGPYSPYSIVIGLTILFLIFAYDVDPDRTIGQSLAFSAVCALISLLVLGYPLEYYYSSDKVVRLKAWSESLPNDISYSQVPPNKFIYWWIFLTVVCVIFDRWRNCKKRTNQRRG